MSASGLVEAPDSDRTADMSRGRFGAITGCEQVQQSAPYSITSSARAKKFSGNSIPVAFAVFMFMTKR